MAYKGRYKVRNPSKYKGDPSRVVYRSLWERKAFAYLDQHPDVIYWSSEEVVVPYISPKDNKIHRYFPDIVVEFKVGDKRVTQMIEIKPSSQTRPPDAKRRNATPTGRVSTRFLREMATYAINDAKWDAARKYCAQKGWQFRIWDEKSLGIK